MPLLIDKFAPTLMPPRIVSEATGNSYTCAVIVPVSSIATPSPAITPPNVESVAGFKLSVTSPDGLLTIIPVPCNLFTIVNGAPFSPPNAL